MTAFTTAFTTISIVLLAMTCLILTRAISTLHRRVAMLERRVIGIERPIDPYTVKLAMHGIISRDVQ